MLQIAVEKDRTSRSNSKDSKVNRNKNITPPKIEYRGITVKEYFRLCD